MGSWGTALYSNDISSDIRDMCNEVYPLLGIDKGTELIFKEYSEIINSDIIDNDYANFWFALADWQWKYGILTDAIKERAISLLEAQAGIEEWEESGTAADVKKRIAVMAKLLDQLKLPQPKMKIPKAKLAKAKHKPGDIIIFRTGSKGTAEFVWTVEECGFSHFFASEVADKLPRKLSPPYEAYEKYMAVLCVGSVQEPYSQYVPEVMETHSIYACYDYLGDEKPTLADLRHCGFLPMNIRYSADAQQMGKNAWTYTFCLFAQSFSKKQTRTEQIIETIACPNESERFHALFDQKRYDDEYMLLPTFFDVFSEIYDSKIRLSLIGIELDNLLDGKQQNPDLRTPEEIQEIVNNMQLEWQNKVDELERSEEYQTADEAKRLELIRALIREDTTAE